MPETPIEGDLPGLEPDVDEEAVRAPSEVEETVDPVDEAINKLGDSLDGYGPDPHAAVDEWFENEYGGNARLDEDLDRIIAEAGSKDPNGWPESGFRDLMQVMWAVNTTSSMGPSRWSGNHNRYRPGRVQWTEDRRNEITSRRAPGTEWYSEERWLPALATLKAFTGQGGASGMSSWTAIATLEDKLAFQHWATINGFSGRGRPTVEKWWRQHLKDHWQLIALGLLGAVGTAAVLAFLFQNDGPDPNTPDLPPPTLQQAAGSGDSAAEEYVELEPSSAEPVDDLDLIAWSPEFFDCPEGTLLDVIGRRLSGKDGEQPESASETTVEQGSNPVCTGYGDGSHVFTMIVEGDGQTLSTAENTSYQVSFIVNNEWPANEFYDDTGFVVHVSWQHRGQGYAWQVLGSDVFNPQPIEGAEVDIEWLDQSTFQVIVEVPGDQVDVIEVRTEMNVYITDDAGNFVFERFDVAIWNTGE